MEKSAEAIVELETRFWQALVDRDIDAATALISASALVTGPQGTGRIDPQSYGDMVRNDQWRLDSFAFSDVDVLFPTADVAILTYKARQKGQVNDQPMDQLCADSSVWVKNGDRWTCSLHTETVLEGAPVKN